MHAAYECVAETYTHEKDRENKKNMKITFPIKEDSQYTHVENDDVRDKVSDAYKRQFRRKDIFRIKRKATRMGVRIAVPLPLQKALPLYMSGPGLSYHL